jgi:basic membrane protein A and related proteins
MRSMSRRRLIQVAGVTGLGLAGLATFAGQCGSSAAPTATTAPAAAPTTAPAAGATSAPAGTTPAAATAGKIKKVAVGFSGQVNDGGWNQPSYTGLVKAKAQWALDSTFTENLDPRPNDWEETIRGYATGGYQLIEMHGAEFQDVVMKVAPDYPDVWFTVDAGSAGNDKNVASMNVFWEQHGFLAGAIMAQMTKSKKIGLVAGMELEVMKDQAEGIKQGAAWVDPSVQVVVTFSGDFQDLAKNKQAALAQAAAGVDVWTHALDQGWLGVAEAVREKQGKIIGFWTDQFEFASDIMVTSIDQGWDKLTYYTIELAEEGKLEPKLYKLGCADQVAGQPVGNYGKWADGISQAIKDKCEQARQAIISGQVKVNPAPKA